MKLADEAALAELAELEVIEYERVRKGRAKDLGIRVTELDAMVAELRGGAPHETANGAADHPFEEDEAWPGPVAGDELLEVLEGALRTHVALDAHAAIGVVLWILHAHAHEAAAISPLLALTSPEKRCGKTTALHVLARLVPRALATSNITSAALFRAVEKWSPTLLVDEADTFLRDSEELRGILNSGHTQASAFVLRTVGDDHEPRRFRTWAPKAIALIGSLHPTLEDRSILVRMRRRRPDERIERLRLGDAEGEATWRNLRRRCARWAADHREVLRQADPDVPAELHDRAADNWRPLFVIADEAGGTWPAVARAAALTLTPGEESSLSTLLLADLRAIFAERGGVRLPSHELVKALVSLEDRPWSECQRGKPLNPNGLARRLRHYDLAPRKMRFGEGPPRQGYDPEAFADAFSRYLPPIASGTPEQSSQSADLRGCDPEQEAFDVPF